MWGARSLTGELDCRVGLLVMRVPTYWVMYSLEYGLVAIDQLRTCIYLSIYLYIYLSTCIYIEAVGLTD